MSRIDLLKIAANLPTAWKSTVIGHAGGGQLKVLRMDGAAYPAETHPFNEALLVLEGAMNLEVAGQVHQVLAGQVYVVPAGQSHAVAPGSRGTLVILDAPQ